MPRNTGASVAAVSLILASMLFFSQGAVRTTASYSMAIASNSSTYNPGQPIHINGTVTPPPGPNTGALVRVLNPRGTVVLIGEADVGSANGTFAFDGVAGGT